MEYEALSRWKSVVCATEIVVVREPSSAVSLACGGAAMVPLDMESAPGAVLNPALAGGTQLGKRYVDEETGLQVLCTKAGDGTLSLDGRALSIQRAKPLPTSD